MSHKEEIPDVHSLWCSFQENCIWKLSHWLEHEKMFVCFQILSQRQQIFFTELIMHSLRIVLKTNNSLNLKITTNKEHTTFPLFLRLFCEQKRKNNKVKYRTCNAEKESIKQKLASVVASSCLLFLFYFILFVRIFANYETKHQSSLLISHTFTPYFTMPIFGWCVLYYCLSASHTYYSAFFPFILRVVIR